MHCHESSSRYIPSLQTHLSINIATFLLFKYMFAVHAVYIHSGSGYMYLTYPDSLFRFSPHPPPSVSRSHFPVIIIIVSLCNWYRWQIRLLKKSYLSIHCIRAYPLEKKGDLTHLSPKTKFKTNLREKNKSVRRKNRRRKNRCNKKEYYPGYRKDLYKQRIWTDNSQRWINRRWPPND